MNCGNRYDLSPRYQRLYSSLEVCRFADHPQTLYPFTRNGYCSITKAELFYGAMRSNNPTQSLKVQQEFLELFVSLAFDDEVARICGRIRAQLIGRGTPIGPNDFQIAAIALTKRMGYKPRPSRTAFLGLECIF